METLCLLVALQQGAMEPEVKRLGSPTYRVREQAQRVLQQQMMVHWSEFLVNGLRRTRGDPEIDYRLSFLIRKWDNVIITQRLKISKLPDDFPQRAWTIWYYQELAAPTIFDMWGNMWEERSQEATRILLLDLKKKGWWTSTLHNLQRQMQRREVISNPWSNGQ